MYRAPNRPKHEITQPFNSGIVTIYGTTDTAKPGYAPEISLKKKCVLRYEEQRAGINRHYAAKQYNIKVERVIRCPQGAQEITTQDIAITEDGRQYKIEQVQLAKDIWPPSWDIALVRITQKVVLPNEVV